MTADAMRINAPWDNDTVRRLNRVQTCGFLHPYTCGICRHDLIAASSRWLCSGLDCEYSQDWANEPPTDEALDNIAAALKGMGAKLDE